MAKAKPGQPSKGKFPEYDVQVVEAREEIIRFSKSIATLKKLPPSSSTKWTIDLLQLMVDERKRVLEEMVA